MKDYLDGTINFIAIGVVILSIFIACYSCEKAIEKTVTCRPSNNYIKAD